jgi:O-antigen/teichoic acid export membrane protein
MTEPQPLPAKDRLFNLLQKYQSFATSAVFRGLGAVSTLVVYRIGSAFYTPTELAPLYFSITLSAILTPMLMLGLNTYSVKRLPTIDEDDRAARLMESVFARYLKVAALVAALAVCVLVVASRLRPDLISFAILAPGLLLFLPASSLIGSFFQGRSKYNTAIFMLNICNNALLALILLASAFAPDRQATAKMLPMAMAVSSFLTICVCGTMAASMLKLSPARVFDGSHVAPMAAGERGEVFRFWANLVVINLSLWTPLVVLYLVGPREQYTYAAVAERLGNAINFFLIISNFFLAPVVARHYPRGETAEMSAKLSQITRITSLACAPVALVTTFAPTLVLSFFGKHYGNGAIYLSIMSCAQFYAVVMGSKNIILNMSGHERDLLGTIIASYVFELILIAILGPTLGAIGFVIAYAANLVCQNTLAGLAVKRRLGIPFWHIKGERVAGSAPARSAT